MYVNFHVKCIVRASIVHSSKQVSLLIFSRQQIASSTYIKAVATLGLEYA